MSVLRCDNCRLVWEEDYPSAGPIPVLGKKIVLNPGREQVPMHDKAFKCPRCYLSGNIVKRGPVKFEEQ